MRPPIISNALFVIDPDKLRAGGQEYSASARIKLFAEGDVAGFAVVRFAQPQNLLESLRQGGDLSLQAKEAALTMPARGAGALLAPFAQACGF